MIRHLSLHVPAATRSGSAIVEMLILLPVLLLVIFAMLYIGELSLYETRTHFGGEFSMDRSGDQSEAAAEHGEISDQFYPGQVGLLTVVEQPPDPADIPGPDEIRDMFDDMSEVIYSTYATGHYIFQNGEIQFVVETHTNARLSADGQYIVGHGLLEDNIPELATEQLIDWERRNRVETSYQYHPGYIDVGDYPLDAVDLSNQYQSTIRAERQREVVNPPPGMLHQIDAVTSDTDMRDAGRLTDYPNFSGDEPFWEPN